MISWEGNYRLAGREILLEVKCEGPDPETGIPGMLIVAARAFDEDGAEIMLSEAEFEAISGDEKLYERIDDKLAADAEAWEERKRS